MKNNRTVFTGNKIPNTVKHIFLFLCSVMPLNLKIDIRVPELQIPSSNVSGETS